MANFADRHAGKLLLLGLAAVALHNWRAWQRDKALLASKAQPPPLPPLAEWPDLPLVSVLVAAWNEADNIANHIGSFQRLRYPYKELVLCAGGPDGTYAIAACHARDGVIVLEQEPGEGKQRALARSFPLTAGSVIFLTDADCLLEDEPFERTLWPVASGVEQAATGGFQPIEDQLGVPLVFTQAAAQLYAAMHGPTHAPGLAGANFAVRRTLLAKTRALDVPAATGTDYVLAKTLAASGAAIRQVPESRVPTEYPATAPAYLRQQRRWLRNVALHGRRNGAQDEVRAALRTSLTGLGMLLLPVIGLLGAPHLLSLWGVLAGQALLARLRYLGFSAAMLGRPVRSTDVGWQAPLLILDFVAWTQPLLDYARRPGRWRW